MPRRLQVANTRRAISPRLATKIRVIIWVLRSSRKRPPQAGGAPTSLSHPEDAEVRRPLDRGIGDGGQAHSQHGAGVARIEDPAVVDPARQEQRQSLRPYPRLPLR